MKKFEFLKKKTAEPVVETLNESDLYFRDTPPALLTDPVTGMTFKLVKKKVVVGLRNDKQKTVLRKLFTVVGKATGLKGEELEKYVSAIMREYYNVEEALRGEENG